MGGRQLLQDSTTIPCSKEPSLNSVRIWEKCTALTSQRSWLGNYVQYYMVVVSWIRRRLTRCTIVRTLRPRYSSLKSKASKLLIVYKIPREERCNLCEPAFIVTESVNNIGESPVHADFNAIFCSSLYEGASLPLVTLHTFPNDELTAKCGAWLWHLSHPVSPDTMRRQIAMCEKEIK